MLGLNFELVSTTTTYYKNTHPLCLFPCLFFCPLVYWLKTIDFMHYWAFDRLVIDSHGLLLYAVVDAILLYYPMCAR